MQWQYGGQYRQYGWDEKKCTPRGVNERKSAIVNCCRHTLAESVGWWSVVRCGLSSG